MKEYRVQISLDSTGNQHVTTQRDDEEPVVDIQTWGEIQAWRMLGRLGEHGGYTTTDPSAQMTPHEAGNKIIALAEQIKAERAVVAMK